MNDENDTDRVELAIAIGIELRQNAGEVLFGQLVAHAAKS